MCFQLLSVLLTFAVAVGAAVCVCVCVCVGVGVGGWVWVCVCVCGVIFCFRKLRSWHTHFTVGSQGSKNPSSGYCI